ncbi:MAG: HNH endonuclease [Chloroflexi bacterium]|nr:HNH endonuclease [Chloroflexota bacterium]MBU1661200.1 HNH endonuclease [Chloroflexota bacterium]
MSTHISKNLRNRVRHADHSHCVYCLTNEANSGIPLTVDHIQPISKGGSTCFENLCLACCSCNEFKASLTSATDPLTGDSVPLFDPRAQQWDFHFRWSNEGTRIEGLTSIGRATVLALRMNRDVIVRARSRWVEGGWHPPENREQ